MKFNTANTIEAQKAFAHLLHLTEKQRIVEVKSVSTHRSLNQNSFLHLLLSAFSLETGNQLHASKDLYKWINKDIYYSKKKIGGEVFVTIRSSADLSKEEMTQTIERFREWSAEQGYPLPTAENEAELRSIENSMEKNGYYL